MLYIVQGGAIRENVLATEWHVGQPLPLINSRVITFQADGDELELILSILRGKPKKERR